MNVLQKLSSKNFFIFNLVLLGAIFGFALAFFSFTLAAPTDKTALAQEKSGPPTISQSSLDVAENVQEVFRYVAEKALPSVVEIKTVSVQRQPQMQNPFDGIPWDFFFGPRDRSPDGQSRPQERRAQGLGSGIIVRRSGDTYFVLTNNHVVGDATEITITTFNGKEYPGTIVGKGGERTDLAIISFKSNEAQILASFGNSDTVKVGDWSIAVGNPLGQMFSTTMGIISAVGRTGGPLGNINDFIQTDASINQGNSGGPLVNIRGEVIGINTWIASSTGGSIGLGFAIPINNTRRIIDELISKGEISYGWLGVSLLDPDKETLEALGVDGKRGALITHVFLESPAEKGGIMPGDYITTLNGKEIRGMNTLTMLVGDMRPGEKATFTGIRDKVQRDFTVTIEARTDELAADSKKLWPGVYVTPITDELRKTQELDSGAQGVFVREVVPGSPADTISVRRGDVITNINGTAIRDLAGFYSVIRDKTRSELYFSVLRNGNKLETMRFKR